MNIDIIPHLLRAHNPENIPARFEMYDDGSARIVTFPGPANPGTVLVTWNRFKKLEQAMAEVDALPWGDLETRQEGQEAEGLEWMKE